MTTKTSQTKSLIRGLHEGLANLIGHAKSRTLSQAEHRSIKKQAVDALLRLEALVRELDTVKQTVGIFDPSDPKVVGRFVAVALVAQDRVPLHSVSRFYGSGVYAIYYRGDFPLYSAIEGSETPVYVGKARPSVPNAVKPSDQGEKLFQRMAEHRKSILKASSTLNLADFDCRFLVVQSGWETAAEEYLIRLFRPIWNRESKILFGLGKHGDAAKTRKNKRSPWDTLHSGRTWAKAKKLRDAKTLDQIKNDLAAHYAANKIYLTTDEVIREFLAGMKQSSKS